MIPYPSPRLLADIGGTYARFAIEVAPGVFECAASLLCSEHADFEAAVTAYRAGLPAAVAARIEHAAVAIANPVEGDEVRIRQILGNLLSNAVKFTEQGQVTFRLGMDGASGLVRCDVTDTGPGIEKSVQAKLFEKFIQGDASVTRKHGGTGLGLAISRQLAELMGGTISVSSQPGAGSTFCVTFRVGAVEQPTVPAKALPPIRTGRKLHILVAEDNAINRKLIALMLDALGHSCVFAEDGQQAVARVTEADFDLVLMDVQMPVLDGVGAAKQIRALGGAVGSIPIVAVTANAMSGDREKYLAAGMDNYVSKPVSLQSLMKLFDELNITPKARAERAAG
jgi:CheY-like chemotaxis protein